MAYDEVGRKADKKYKQKFDLFQVRLPQGSKEKISQHAKDRGESLNTFVSRAINETMERDKANSSQNTSEA